MKYKSCSIFLISLFCSGCGIGGMWMNGNPDVGRNITPLSDKWTKSDMTPEKRRRDWVECGGMVNGGYGSTPSGNTTQEIQAASNKKFDELQVCMLGKGYSYAGGCTGNIAKTYPACQLSQ